MKCYQNIHELPLKIFIEIQVTGDLSKLIIGGLPSREDLEKAWSTITEQYTSGVAEIEVKSKLHDLKTIAVKESRILEIELLLELIKLNSSEKIFKLLYSFGYPIPTYSYSRENVNKVLKVFIGHFKLERIQYQLLIDKFQDKSDNSEIQNSYEYYDDMIASICISMKLPSISIDSISVGQYVSYVKRFKSYLKSLKSNQ